MARTGHDLHFLQRVSDRTRGAEMDFLLGLYRDREFVRFLLGELHIAPGVGAVALAVGEEGPYAVVVPDGHFVTCLEKGMRVKDALLVARGKIDALFAKSAVLRERRALAVQRGIDDKRAIEKLEKSGPALSREDFLATAGLLGPATTVLMQTYAGCVRDYDETMPYLLQRGLDAKLRQDWSRELAQHAWGMVHAPLMHLDYASREWVEQWAQLPAHATGSPWMALVTTFEVPMLARAAWLAGRLGKTFFPFYKQRFSTLLDPIDLLEAGWGLVAMGLRHAALRGDVERILSAPPPPGASDVLVAFRAEFATVAENLKSGQDQQLLDAALTIGRASAWDRTHHLEEGARHRYPDAGRVPDDIALATMLEIPFDAMDLDAVGGLETSFRTMLMAVVASARQPAEAFYLPATFLHARGPEDLEEHGARLAARRRSLAVADRNVRREGPKVGRNDPCPCGSGKKFKKCCGG
jgi:hypothetical protein